MMGAYAERLRAGTKYVAPETTVPGLRMRNNNYTCMYAHASTVDFETGSHYAALTGLELPM